MYFQGTVSPDILDLFLSTFVRQCLEKVQFCGVYVAESFQQALGDISMLLVLVSKIGNR